ncbi:MAG: pyridoxal-phosphate dependent enzyme, partial [Chloroflexota bacterium]
VSNTLDPAICPANRAHSFAVIDRVESVTDQEILDAKALIDRAGIGCEPASACSLAGAKKLAAQGIIKPHETVLGVLTGHVLKDPDATIGYHGNTLEDIEPQYRNELLTVGDDIEAIVALLQEGDEPAPVQ